MARVTENYRETAPDPALDVVRARIQDLYCIPATRDEAVTPLQHGQDPPPCLRANYIAALDAHVQALLDTQETSGTWPEVAGDVAYHVDLNATYWNRPYCLGVAYCSPDSRWHGAPHVMAALDRALAWGAQFTRPGHRRWKNWWAPDIGAPKTLGILAHLLRPHVPTARTLEFVEHLYYLTYEPQSLGVGKYIGTGANATWLGINALRIAALANDRKLAERARAIVAEHSRVEPAGCGEGLMPDGTWHQHGNGLNMGYGESHLDSLAEYVYLTRGTPLALEPEVLEDSARLLDFAAWASFRGQTDPFTRGRAGTRAGQVHDYVVPFLLIRAAGPPPALAGPVHAFFQGRPPSRALVSYHFPQTTTLHARWAHLESEPLPPAPLGSLETPLTGARASPHSGHLIARSSHHFLSLRCPDQNLKSWFSIHDENRRGYYEKEGAVFFLTPAHPLTRATQYHRPWDARMGVTRVPGVHPGKEQYGQGALTACCTSNGVGVIATRYRHRLPGGGALEAHKSYVTWADQLLQVGSHVRLTGVTNAPDSSGPPSLPRPRTSLLTIPLASRLGRERTPPPPERIELLGQNWTVEALRERDKPVSLPEDCTGRAGAIGFVARDTPGLSARVVEIECDPRHVNKPYAPRETPPPVPWLVVECEHAAPRDTSENAPPPDYQFACRFAPSPVSPTDLQALQRDFPRVTIRPEAHVIAGPWGTPSPVEVPFHESLLDAML